MSKMLRIEDAVPTRRSDIEGIIKENKSKFNITLYKRLMNDVASKGVGIIDDIYFQTSYGAFYGISRFKSLEWKKAYYKVFKEIIRNSKHDKRVDIADILQKLHDIDANDGRKVELSFASKMIATIDKDRPIYDSNVAKALKVNYSSSKNSPLYIAAKDIYEELEANYKSYMRHPNHKAAIEAFNNECPEGESISPTKKIDFILWSIGKGE